MVYEGPCRVLDWTSPLTSATLWMANSDLYLLAVRGTWSACSQSFIYFAARPPHRPRILAG
jgi:hypothetical protein